MEKEMTTLVEVIQKMRDKQFIHDFEIREGKAFSKDTGESFTPDDLIIERTYRYEGDSNPDDMAVAYGITASSGTKGILIDAYGTYSNAKVSEFIKQVPVKEIE